MPHHDTVALSGIIRHVFAHRFTLEAEGRMHLADLGPKGAEAFPPRPGLTVAMTGERRPSEIKVARIAAPGRDPVEIHHKKPHHGPGPGAADPAAAVRAALAAGWAPEGMPQTHPRHVELTARRSGGGPMRLHIDRDGTIAKAVPLAG